MSEIKYRADIDGLRALAVSTVVLFHAKLGLTPGGYIGVDVFFVISGYLITSIIVSELKRGVFSLAGFYERRIRRIFPALLVVVATCLAIGAWRMAPHDYGDLARSAIATLGFHSNFWFADNAGYFMPQAELLPLLHTWSLGVEEQFYIVAPLVLMAALPARRVGARFIFAALLIVGIGLSVWGTYQNVDTAFYLPHTRAFELLIGVGLALGMLPQLRSQRLAQVLSSIGLALILAAVVLFSEETPLFFVLLPCLGAALIIYSANAGEELTTVGRLLALTPVVALGKISYSLYLWHWPLFAFAEYEWSHQVTVPMRLSLIAASIALAALTYRWIEQPARRSKHTLTRRRVFVFGPAAAASLAAAALAIVISAGWPSRLAPDVAAFAARILPAATTNVDCRRKDLRPNDQGCPLGIKSSAPSFLIWGDSHASILQAQLDELADASGQSGLLIARGGCVPFFNIDSTTSLRKRKCLANAGRARSALNRGTIRAVVLVARWAKYAEPDLEPDTDRAVSNWVWTVDVQDPWPEFERHFKRTLAELTKAGLRVVIVGPVPELAEHLPSAMIKARMRGRQFSEQYDYSAFLERQRRVLGLLAKAEELESVKVVYPHRVLCPSGVCALTEGGRPLYRDDNHLSRLGVQYLMPELERVLRANVAAKL